MFVDCWGSEVKRLAIKLWNEPAAFLGTAAAVVGLVAVSVPMPEWLRLVLAGGGPLLAGAATRSRVRPIKRKATR